MLTCRVCNKGYVQQTREDMEVLFTFFATKRYERRQCDDPLQRRFQPALREGTLPWTLQTPESCFRSPQTMSGSQSACTSESLTESVPAIQLTYQKNGFDAPLPFP
jgi:hypothetical protein